MKCVLRSLMVLVAFATLFDVSGCASTPATVSTLDAVSSVARRAASSFARCFVRELVGEGATVSTPAAPSAVRDAGAVE